MGLIYPGEWKFEGVGFGIPTEAVSEFTDLIVETANGSKSVIEDFKAAFGSIGGSSSYEWALSDMYSIVGSKSPNAASFIDSLWKGIEEAKARDLQVPSHRAINKILEKYSIPLKIAPPNLLLTKDSSIIDAESASKGNSVYDTVPMFVLGEKIGGGGYGVVYRATRSTSVFDFSYALKVLDPSPFVEDYDKALRRFKREVKALQGLQHRAIVQYFEAGLTLDNKPYIVMPLITGSDLRSAARATDLPGVIGMFIEILQALEYAHVNDVLHRDLKPSNIVVRSSDNQPIILDFGSAYILDQLDTKDLTSQAVGTIGYIPSEVLMEPKKRSPLHDVYACGIMLYEALAGRRPDPMDYEPLAKLDREYGALDDIIKQAIAGERRRLSSAGEFASKLISL
ncbi:MAG TPA: serine/threonine-protein kinase [Thermoanaerobaculia bacterium]|nr:serine/threonine-protein kinase [Thermoanaerobaculia bacterium]